MAQVKVEINAVRQEMNSKVESVKEELKKDQQEKFDQMLEILKRLDTKWEKVGVKTDEWKCYNEYIITLI